MRKGIAVFLLLSAAALAQDSKRLIFVDHAGSDPAGIRLAFALKEAIRKSSGYALAETNDHANGTFIVELVTIGVPQQHPTDIEDSAVSMMTHQQIGQIEMPVGHDLFFTSLEITDSQAQTALARLDAEVVRTITALKKALAVTAPASAK
jgi:hypothetical protein